MRVLSICHTPQALAGITARLLHLEAQAAANVPLPEDDVGAQNAEQAQPVVTGPSAQTSTARLGMNILVVVFAFIAGFVVASLSGQ